MSEQSEWAETLPDNCPPSEAWEPNNEVYYRLVDSHPPTVRDFASNRELQPQRRLKSVTECEARSLSVYDNVEECRKVQKFPALRNKQVAKVALMPECGVVLQTTSNLFHHSWWLKAACDPVSICEPV